MSKLGETTRPQLYDYLHYKLHNELRDAFIEQVENRVWWKATHTMQAVLYRYFLKQIDGMLKLELIENLITTRSTYG